MTKTTLVSSCRLSATRCGMPGGEALSRRPGLQRCHGCLAATDPWTRGAPPLGVSA